MTPNTMERRGMLGSDGLCPEIFSVTTLSAKLLHQGVRRNLRSVLNRPTKISRRTLAVRCPRLQWPEAPGPL
jgi:hypothetical protein